MKPSRVIGLDVGEKRIGVALADGNVRIAVPHKTIDVDGNELDRIARLVEEESVETVVIGYPRNQSGEATAQSALVEEFADRLSGMIPIDPIFQDESLTSVQAEEILRVSGRPYIKADIDAGSAVLILQDYIETTHEK